MFTLKRIIVVIAIVISGASLLSVAAPAPASAQGNPGCAGRFLTLPVWYRGLNGADQCQPRITGPGDVWRIAFNIVEALIHVAAYVSAFYVLWGGIQYMISVGEPAKVASAKSTIQNALVGLVIAIFAVAIVSLIAEVV